MKRIFLALIVTGIAAAMVMPAGAQSARYQVHSLDFDIWCTEEQHLPYERCDQRLPEDMERFEAYRAIVERYEVPYLREKETTLRFPVDILNSDTDNK